MTRVPQINIGLFGFGTVGSQVYHLLEKHQTLLQSKLGYPIHIKKICETEAKKKAITQISPSLYASKPADVLDDPEISIIVELIGDKPVAREVMLQAMELGKHVVTANKAVLSAHGPELYQKAEQHEVDLLFEAAVAGAIPILRSVREGFISDRIEAIWGIINGTSNYILTEMGEKKRSYASVLEEAQKKGYAESNPSADVEGYDTAHKIILLTALAYGQIVPLDKISVEGITSITPLDFEMAEKFGYRIKLLAISKKHGDEIEVRVSPTMLPVSHMLSSVRGAFNAVMLQGEFLGQSLFYGLGAGGAPTATAVVGDIVQIARNIALRVPGAPPLGTPMHQIQKAKLRSSEEVESEYYIRFNVYDKPGVFAKIATILGQNHISISSVYQHGQEEGKEVPIVVFTHRSKEKNVLASIKEIDKLSIVSQKTTLLRVET